MVCITPSPDVIHFCIDQGIDFFEYECINLRDIHKMKRLIIRFKHEMEIPCNFMLTDTIKCFDMFALAKGIFDGEHVIFRVKKMMEYSLYNKFLDGFFIRGEYYQCLWKKNFDINIIWYILGDGVPVVAVDERIYDELGAVGIFDDVDSNDLWSEVNKLTVKR